MFLTQLKTGLFSPGVSLEACMATKKNHFDFLRLFFAALVLYSHSFVLVQNGEGYRDILNWTQGQTYPAEIAVNGFFLISGFLITVSWTRSKGIGEFFRKRVLRIYPGFIAACAFCALIAAPLGTATPVSYLGAVANSITSFVLHVLTLDTLSLPPAFLANPLSDINGSLWTIRIEFECYALVPLLLLIGGRTNRKLVFVAAALCWSAYAGLLLIGPMVFHGPNGVPESLETHGRFGTYFLIGMGYYLFRDRVMLSGRGVVISLAALAITAGVGGFNAVAPPAVCYLIMAFAFNQKVRVPNLGRNFDLSYGLYLYAWPVQQLIVWYGGKMLSPYVLFLLALPPAALLAAGSWFAIERPFLRLRDAGAGKTAAAAVVV